jgi:DNA mismatch endonuclease (patch repair protein)
MHDCPRFKHSGGDNADFWRAKLTRNAERDCEVTGKLLVTGWRQFVVWECALIGKGRLDLPEVVGTIGAWLTSDAETGEIAGLFD